MAMGGAQKLPIYIEESHAGSFYFLADRLAGAEKPHRLILFDAHSDASAIYGSDQIRAALAKCSSAEQRAEMFRKWRTRGIVQCFDWIEPLVPELVSDVVWIPQQKMTEADRLSRQTKARSQLDAHEEAEPRSAGQFASRYQVMDFETWEKSPNDQPTVVSIDLDYFAAMPEAECAVEMEAILQAALQIRSLSALTFSISSPFQPTRERAERLLLLALDASFRVVNATVQFEPYATTGKDKSLQALLLERQGKQLPAFQLENAGGSLQALLLQYAHKLHPQFST